MPIYQAFHRRYLDKIDVYKRWRKKTASIRGLEKRWSMFMVVYLKVSKLLRKAFEIFIDNDLIEEPIWDFMNWF